ncbi:filamentous hemagglutinin N-terminal domain-containing protein [Pseudorhodoferax sp. LjRoot39]|uniref:two-partner secretion domain-containing protein n=1 Tax=Pseudorhodoferax sp. LjRoot39 TaxID=3342328 RepID=UPI003ED0736F
MNHVYRLVRNAAGQARPIPECGRGRGKSGKPALVLAATLALPAFAQHQLPTGASVAAGQASVASQGAQLTVTQGSDKAIMNWQRFDIGSQAAVRFVQPSASSVALNRVLAGEASQIHGQLSANGQVYLVNPAGIVFGPGSRVDVGGLVASVMDIADADFLAGRNVFRRNGATGSIVNQGEITAADGGLVALLAPTVRNEGVIRAQLGNVALAAGDQVTLHAGADGHLQLAIEPATLQTLVENRQLIVADGGQVLMTSGAADALSSGVVANSGTVQARTLQQKEGRILLLADMAHGEVRHGGLLDASAPAGGNGGFVETSAATVTLQDGRRVDTRATQGATGTWLIDPNDYTIAASGGNITGAQLSSDLASSNVTIATASQGTAGGNGDIFVNDAVGWSANTLTLNAERHIEINAVMTASGTAGLAMNYGGTNGNPAATPAADSRLMVGFAPGVANGFVGRVDFPHRSGTGFLSINGQGYHVLGAGDLGVAGDATTTTLQGMANNLSGHYALGANIDASATAGWNGGLGFQPIGISGSEFTATFDGLGHVIGNLHIARTSEFGVGLFGVTMDATLRNVGLAQSVVSGLVDVGTLAGAMYTSGPAAGTRLYNVFASDSIVQAANSSAGGLLGEADNATNGGVLDIRNAYSTGTVAAPDTAGGLIGELNIGMATLADAYSTSTVAGDNIAGGLVGRIFMPVAATADLRNVHAAGTVTTDPLSGQRVGGLLGELELYTAALTITDASASGNVVGYENTGGLVGAAALYDPGSTLHLLRSSASGTVLGANNLGGLIGRLGITGTGTTSSLNAVQASATIGPSSAYGTFNVGGLIGQTLLSDATLRITQASTTGLTSGGRYTGGLLGDVGLSNHGHLDIADSQATGNIAGSHEAGGLVGQLKADAATAAITRSHATGALAGGDALGGLIGYVQLSGQAGLALDSVYATGDVAGISGAGGLVGYVYTYGASTLAVSNAYATGSVSGDTALGGLIGHLNTNSGATATFSDVHASGNVSGRSGTAGLVGNLLVVTGSTTAFTRAYATGNATADYTAGGLLGTAYLLDGGRLRVDVAYAAGDVTVTTSEPAGGLVGLISLDTTAASTLDIANAYAIGAVSGHDRVGGLIGHIEGTPAAGAHTVRNTYAAGAVSGGSAVGGLIGAMDPGTSVTASYWDLQRSGQASSAAGAGLTTAGMRTLGSFQPVWDISPRDGDATVWRIYEGLASPVLRPFQPQATGIVQDVTRTYDGRAHAGGAGVVYSGSVPGGTVVYLGNSQGATQVGHYILDAVLTPVDPASATQLDYQRLADAMFQPGSLTITPAALGIAANNASKVYGQTHGSGGSAFTATGLQNGETVGTVALTSSGAAATAGAGNHTIAASGASGGSFNAANYTITYQDGTLTVTPAALTITANDASKVQGLVLVFDGTEFTAAGLQNGETIGSVALASNGAAAAGAVGSHAITVSGAGAGAGAGAGSFVAGNYAIRYEDGRLTVTPAPIAPPPTDNTPLPPKPEPPLPAAQPTPHIVEEMERSVLAQGQARSRAAAAALPDAMTAAATSGVPFLSLAPQLVRVED